MIGSSSNDFARQLAERNAELNPASAKKFRSSAAPKGTRLGPGYQDRTQLRTSGEEDDKATRIKALEDMVKLGQMDQATFEALRDEIVGGDVNNVHLVKGLDYKLLERVRRGEDVLSSKEKPKQTNEEVENIEHQEINVDEELEELENKPIEPIEREEKDKRGVMAPPPLAGKKRTRDDILKELKASRAAAAEKAKQSALGPKFVKVGQNKEKSRFEKDSRGRDVLITVDADGKVKRKVKKTYSDDTSDGHGLLMPDKDAKPLGMEVEPVAPQPAEDEGDIFDDVGTDYNPLGDVVDEESESDDDEDGSKKPSSEQAERVMSPPGSSASASFRIDPPPNKKRNWLGDTQEEEDAAAEKAVPNTLKDPAILAALKKASTINPISQEAQTEEEATSVTRRKRLLESHDRDADDMDLDFGSSRFGDQEDGEDSRVKLSEWGDADRDDGGKGGSKMKRKRGGKKRKGDANSAADVLKVMERQKAEAK